MSLFIIEKSLRENSTVKCPNCGATFRGGHGRCPACGYRVQVKQLARRCPECKARVAEGAKTCLMCGASLQAGRSFLPQVSLSMVPPAPLLGAAAAVVLLVALWFVKPWRALQFGTYHTPTPSPTLTSTPTFTPTATSTPTLAPTETATPEVTTYIVQSGDTLSLIAAHFGIPVDAIMAANDLPNYTIQIGQELVIPVETPSPGANPQVSETPVSGSSPQPEPMTYVVQPGDSLSEIARRFDVTLDDLMEANDIVNPDSIREGQTLQIPGRISSTETPGIGGPPTPTVSSPLIYPDPALLGPPDGFVFREQDAEVPILLNWLSVGLLGEDEWYSVSIRSAAIDGTEGELATEFTKANSYRVPLELRPPEDAESHLIQWQVTVVRLVETEAEGGPVSEPISHQSEPRTFYWY
jgi:LysM repeat protein